MKKRIVMLFSVVALMVVMLAMSVAPAFAAWQTSGEDAGCRTGDFLRPTFQFPAGASQDGKRSADGWICVVSKGFNDFRYYDNRPSPTL